MASNQVLVPPYRGRAILAALAGFVTLTAFAAPQSPASLKGFWFEPSGGIIQVAPCGPKLCATLIAFSRKDVGPFRIGWAVAHEQEDTSIRFTPR